MNSTKVLKLDSIKVENILSNDYMGTSDVCKRHFFYDVPSRMVMVQYSNAVVQADDWLTRSKEGTERAVYIICLDTIYAIEVPKLWTSPISLKILAFVKRYGELSCEKCDLLCLNLCVLPLQVI